MTPTLSPQQREEVLEAMARAICACTIDPESCMPDGTPYWRLYANDAAAALDAALPAIIGAVWLEAAERMERRMDACDIVALTSQNEQMIREARIKECAYRAASEEFRALAEEAR